MVMWIYIVWYFDNEKVCIILDFVLYSEFGVIGFVLVWVMNVKEGDSIMLVGFGSSKGFVE